MSPPRAVMSPETVSIHPMDEAKISSSGYFIWAKLCGPQSRLATVKYPGTDAEHGIENRKGSQRMRKYSSDHEGHEHGGNEYQSVEDGGGAKLCCAGTTTE